MEQSSDKIPIRKGTNMSPTSEKGPRFGVNPMAGRGETVRRPSDVPSLSPRTTEIPPEPPKRHLIRRLMLILAAIAAGESAIIARQHHINYQEPLNPFGIAMDVSSIPGGWWNLGKSAQENIMEKFGKYSVPETLDNTVAETTIGDRNILRNVSKETVQKTPSFDTNGNPLLLIATPPEGSTSRVKKSLSEQGLDLKVLEEAKRQNITDGITIDNLQQGQNIPIPIDGYLFLIGRKNENGEPDVFGAKVEFLTPDGTLGFVNIQPDDIRTTSLIDAPWISEDNLNGKDYTKGLPVKRGDALFKIMAPQMGVFYFGQGGKDGSLYNQRIPLDINVLTLRDPSTGNQKVPSIS